jgi:hypothetical protein
MYTVCKGGGWGMGLLLGLQRSPFTVNFFWMTTFCIAFYESYLSTLYIFSMSGRRRERWLRDGPPPVNARFLQSKHPKGPRWSGISFKIIFGGILYFIVLYSTLLHLSPLRFHCANKCMEPRTVANGMVHWQPVRRSNH